jgi:hypothetical protein
MLVLRWLLALLFSVIADLANPALPGALEAFAEVEESVHSAGHRRAARPTADARPGRLRPPDHGVQAAAAPLVGPRLHVGLARQQPRKIPPLISPDSAPDAH